MVSHHASSSHSRPFGRSAVTTTAVILGLALLVAGLGFLYYDAGASGPAPVTTSSPQTIAGSDPAASTSTEPTSQASLAQTTGPAANETTTDDETETEPSGAIDPLAEDQWSLGTSALDLEDAWATTRGDRNITVAVLDSGVDRTHEDLTDVPAGFDFFNQDAEAEDDCGHGTHVAGIVGAQGGNELGITGIAQVEILPVKVLGIRDGHCTGTFDALEQGITYAADQGADVIVMSLGCQQPCYHTGVHDAIKAANDQGVLIVAAAGNNTGEPVNFPANQPEVLAVSALDTEGEWADYSAKGPEVELLAPGSSILSTIPGDGYEWMSGTSMAAPHVAGAAALLMSADPGLTAEETRELLTSSAQDLGLDQETQGHGALDINAALASLLSQ